MEAISPQGPSKKIIIPQFELKMNIVRFSVDLSKHLFLYIHKFSL